MTCHETELPLTSGPFVTAPGTGDTQAREPRWCKME